MIPPPHSFLELPDPSNIRLAILTPTVSVSSSETAISITGAGESDASAGQPIKRRKISSVTGARLERRIIFESLDLEKGNDAKRFYSECAPTMAFLGLVKLHGSIFTPVFRELPAESLKAVSDYDVISNAGEPLRQLHRYTKCAADWVGPPCSLPIGAPVFLVYGSPLDFDRSAYTDTFKASKITESKRAVLPAAVNCAAQDVIVKAQQGSLTAAAVLVMVPAGQPSHGDGEVLSTSRFVAKYNGTYTSTPALANIVIPNDTRSQTFNTILATPDDVGVDQLDCVAAVGNLVKMSFTVAETSLALLQGLDGAVRRKTALQQINSNAQRLVEYTDSMIKGTQLQGVDINDNTADDDSASRKEATTGLINGASDSVPATAGPAVTADEVSTLPCRIADSIPEDGTHRKDLTGPLNPWY